MPERMRKVCVLGLGYIGLPTASLLAAKGFEVRGVDVAGEVVETINAGSIHIEEPDLDVLVRSVVRGGRLSAALAPEPADVFVIAVPTPLAADRKPDLSFVEAATRSLAPVLAEDNLVILESTSPVGTTERVAAWLREERPELAAATATARDESENRLRIRVAYCPERVLPGRILRELMDNDRIVGGVDNESTRTAARFYRNFVAGKVLETDCRTAELVKLAENSFRDVNIAYANELAGVCEELGVDVWKLIEFANLHPRVNILQPGPGVGGHCIAVDPWFIVDSAPERARLIRSAREVNDARPGEIVNKALRAAAGISRPTVACLGLAYKPDIDDLRESPAVEIVAALARSGRCRVLAVAPYIDRLPAALARLGVELVELDAAIDAADVVVALVAHARFRELADPTLSGKRVVDACGLWRSSR